MSPADRAIRLAAALLPREQRAVRLEEWSADLEHCAELGMTRSDVASGALRAALIDGLGWRTALGRSRWLAAGSITIALAVLSVPAGAITAFAIGQMRGVVTIETAPDGAEHEVHWKDYPGTVQHEIDGYRELDPESVLAGPSAEEAWAQGRALLAEIESALSAEFGLQWVEHPGQIDWDEGLEDEFAFPRSNGYGGHSLLVTLNSPTSQSSSVPNGWAAKERAIAVIADIASAHGYGEPRLDHDQPWMTPEEAANSFGSADPSAAVLVAGTLEGPLGQWLHFSFQDLTLDREGRFADDAADGAGQGWQPNRVTLAYGADALLPTASRDEFRERSRAFEGYVRPAPLVSD